MVTLPDIQNMLSIMGKAQDAKIAETMLQQKTVFWVPKIGRAHV